MMFIFQCSHVGFRSLVEVIALGSEVAREVLQKFDEVTSRYGRGERACKVFIRWLVSDITRYLEISSLRFGEGKTILDVINEVFGVDAQLLLVDSLREKLQSEKVLEQTLNLIFDTYFSDLNVFKKVIGKVHSFVIGVPWTYLPPRYSCDGVFWFDAEHVRTKVQLVRVGKQLIYMSHWRASTSDLVITVDLRSSMAIVTGPTLIVRSSREGLDIGYLAKVMLPR